MIILLNTTKTMNMGVPLPARLKTTIPACQTAAETLMTSLRRLSAADLADRMDLSAKLTGETQARLAQWGRPGQPLAPALFAFTGLVYKYLDPAAWPAPALHDAQQRLVILSGLYGMLRPLDRIAAYRLEMGSKFKPPRAANLVAFWRDTLTDALNVQLKQDEAIINLAAQEYTKALKVKELKGPLISPIFKEVRPDGGLKNVSVHAKMARGSLVKYVFTTGAKRPRDLLGFGELGWEASEEPPASGQWLFTRPVRD